MAKIIFEEGDYVTFLGEDSSVPIGRVVKIMEDGYPLVVYKVFAKDDVRKKIYFEDESFYLIPAKPPSFLLDPKDDAYLIGMFNTISAIFPELPSPPPTEDEPVEHSSPSPSDDDVLEPDTRRDPTPLFYPDEPT